MEVVDDWVDGTITFYDDSRRNKQKSLRQKIHDHQNTKAHIAEIKAVQDRSNETLKKPLDLK